MKKTIVLVLSVGLMISPLFAYAAVDCSVTPSDPTCHVGGGTDPNLVTQVWGLTGYDTPHFKAGETITDQHGYTDTCPSWYPKAIFGACQNISGTQYYISRMNSLAQQLISIYGSKATAASQAPMFVGWINAQ